MLNRGLLILTIFSVFLANAQTSVTIGWDTSLSMKNRNTAKEFEFLDSYFKKYENAQVELIAFNNVNSKKKTFNVVDGNWDQIKTALSTSIYDGGTSYQNLTPIGQDHTLLLFTDGDENALGDIPKIEGTLYVINSMATADMENLKYLALGNKGRLVTLSPQVASSMYENGESMVIYTGNIYSDDSGNEDISISVKGTDNTVTAKKNGTYSIRAKQGSTLVFSAPALPAVEKVVGRENTLNVWIKSRGIELDQVLIRKELVETEPNVVSTGFNKRDKRKVGFSVSSIGDEQITEINTNISDATEGKFAGVTRGTNQDLSQSVIRGLSTLFGNNYPLIIIDGAPIARSSSADRGANIQLTDFIDPNSIADVTVLKGLAATNNYGSEGSSGVILITTKMAAAQKAAENGEPAPKPKNLYEGNVEAKAGEVITPYLSQLSAQSTVENAYNAYLNQREQYWSNPAYFIDVANFFKASSPVLSNQIIYNAIEKSDSPVAAIRGAFFKAETEGNKQLALDIANEFIEKYPQNTQAYLDVALANRRVGNYQLALEILVGIENGTVNPALDFSDLTAIADKEIRNLVAAKKEALDLSKIQVKHLKQQPLDARVIFEWSNSDAEFELQFVNPSNLFSKWEHTKNNERMIANELVNGSQIEEFEIDGGAKGQWIINVKYLGNRSEGNNDPTFLKCTVQENYGKPEEKTTQHIIRLYEEGSEELAVKLFTR